MHNEWAAVPGWDGYYEASLGGMVRNIMPRKGSIPGKVLKGRPTRDGYLKVVLQKKGATKQSTFVHRLIYQVFKGPIPDGFEVDHLDSCKTNNRASNLEAVPKLVNMQRSFAKGRNMARGAQQGKAVFTDEIVASIRKRVSNGEKQNAIAAEFGVTPTAINCIVKRKTWAHVSP